MDKSRKTKPRSAGDILGAMRQTPHLRAVFLRAAIWDHWPELAGKRLAAHAQPAGLRETTLIVEADSPAFMHRVAHEKWAIVRRINRMAKTALVTDLFVRLGDGDGGPESARHPQDNV